MQLKNIMWLFALGLPLSEVFVGAHSAHGHQGRGHQDISKRLHGGIQVWKRISQSKWSFYDVGLGACGKTNVESDYIVALNAAQYGGGSPGPQCFKYITMTYNGKTTKAQIMDMCPGCPYGGLDLSRGLFDFFASQDKGIIFGSWSFAGEGDDGDDEPKSTTKKPPKTTYRPTETTSKWTPTSTSGSDATNTGSSTNSTGGASSGTLTIDYSVGVASGLAVPVATGVLNVQDGNNINNFNAALVGLGGLVVAGARIG